MATTILDTGDNEERKPYPYVDHDKSDPCPRCGSIYKIVYSATNMECLNCKAKRNKRPNKFLEDAIRNIEERGKS